MLSCGSRTVSANKLSVFYSHIFFSGAHVVILCSWSKRRFFITVPRVSLYFFCVLIQCNSRLGVAKERLWAVNFGMAELVFLVTTRYPANY